MKKLLFVYNMHAGKGQISSRLGEIVDIFTKNGYEATLHPTQDAHDARNRIMAMAPGEYDLLVCSGGDGTLNEAVSAVHEAGLSDMAVGYIPAGTTNDFASSMGIPRDMGRAALTAVTGAEFHADLGKLEDRYFCYVAAFGLFSDVSYETNQDLKNFLGRPAYLLEGLKRLANVPSYELVVDGDNVHLEGTFVLGMITNSQSVGGFQGITGQNVFLDDGLSEVILIRKSDNLLELTETVAGALNSGLETSVVERFKTSHLTIEAREEIPWTVDGEFGGTYRKCEIVNFKQAAIYRIPAGAAASLEG